jgi:uncharacterized membrane protein
MNQTNNHINIQISRPTAALILLSALSCLLELFKIGLKNDLSGLGLVWNLFLAWLPLGFILIARRKAQTTAHRKPFPRGRALSSFGFQNFFQGVKLYFFVFLWLLFFPNTTYIITDLIHIPEYNGRLLWYDSLRIFLFALAGLAVGLYSMMVAHQVFNRLFGRIKAWWILSFAGVLSGYGIYLGRFERFNSWDLFTNPFSLVRQVIGDFNNPLAIQTTLAFATVTMVLYVCLNLISSKAPSPRGEQNIM